MTIVSEPASFLQVKRTNPRAVRGSISSSAVKSRVYVAMLAFACVYAAIAGRLVLLAQMEEAPSRAWISAQDSVSASRPDLIDRNGEILATDIKTASLYAEPRRILDVDEAVEGLIRVLPELDEKLVRRRLESGAGFVWLKREMTPQKADQIHNLGLPGIGFLSENQRFYPGGPTAGHIVGSVNVDNQGLAGIEKIHRRRMAWRSAIARLCLREIDGAGPAVCRPSGSTRRARRAGQGDGAIQSNCGCGYRSGCKDGRGRRHVFFAGLRSNDRSQALERDRLNRATGGVFEMGSVFKAFTTAMALDSGSVSINDSFDATRPIRAAGRTITDFHGKNRILSVPEIFIYSSNIGTAKMMLATGVARQKEFLERLHLTNRLKTELPENAAPLLPPKWNELAAMTISFGHGLSVTPMQTAVAAAAVVNGGTLLPPTFMPRSEEDAQAVGKQVISPDVSRMMRYLFRLNVLSGSGRRADVPGYTVGGKTGTAEKIENGALRQ